MIIHSGIMSDAEGLGWKDTIRSSFDFHNHRIEVLWQVLRALI